MSEDFHRSCWLMLKRETLEKPENPRLRKMMDKIEITVDATPKIIKPAKKKESADANNADTEPTFVQV